jgi:hypothetical protein
MAAGARGEQTGSRVHAAATAAAAVRRREAAGGRADREARRAGLHQHAGLPGVSPGTWPPAPNERLHYEPFPAAASQPHCARGCGPASRASPPSERGSGASGKPQPARGARPPLPELTPAPRRCAWRRSQRPPRPSAGARTGRAQQGPAAPPAWRSARPGRPARSRRPAAASPAPQSPPFLDWEARVCCDTQEMHVLTCEVEPFVPSVVTGRAGGRARATERRREGGGRRRAGRARGGRSASQRQPYLQLLAGALPAGKGEQESSFSAKLTSPHPSPGSSPAGVPFPPRPQAPAPLQRGRWGEMVARNHSCHHCHGWVTRPC